MRRSLARALFVVAVLLLPLSGGVGAQSDDLDRVPRITQAQFRELLAKKQVVVLDTRDEAAYVSGHIPGALPMPLDQIAQRAVRLKGEKRLIVTYCA